MADKVYSSAKPIGTTANPRPFPPAKPQLYNPNRQPYRAQANRQRRRRCSRRRCFYLCCFWSILLLIALLLLAAIAGATVYVLYRPHRPDFSVSSLRISQFNLSTSPDDSTHLTTKLNLTISAKNSNKKIVFFYDPIAISALSNQVQIANGSFPNFTSSPNNITIVHCTLTSSSQVLDAESVNWLKSNLRRRVGVPVKILLDTMVVVKMDGMKSRKVGIRVKCEGIRGFLPKGKSPSVAAVSGATCTVDLRIKIWKWTF